jgi:tripeptidyl-peptidase-1
MAAIHKPDASTTLGQLSSRQRAEHHQLLNMGVSALYRFLVTVAFASVASCTTSPLKLRQIIEPPRNWVNLGRTPSSHVIPLRIGLPQLRFSELEEHLAETSDPFHPSYGKHLSKEDVEALVAPGASSVEAIHDWLGSHGVQKDACHHSPAGDWVTVHLPVGQVENMLGTVRYYFSFLQNPTQGT